ncbi:MarR family winged helix-turn-helix transcriptional regulator [Aeromicrobium sp. NPDC092404]|uniref:MarR family winged helix-turn-helix transcriptional regulator n=1 Tax=Aeromicrobium sp. NPDC092404 TaxID=3154976 RepID=UPI00343D2DFE
MTDMAEATTVESSIDLGQALGTLLRRYLESATEAISDLPGGPRGYQVLSIASSNPSSNQAGIAELMGLDRTVMTYLVDDLERAGLVERRPDPSDRRARLVVLTAAGRTTFAAHAARIGEVERALLGPLSETDAEVFRQLLLKIASAGPVVGACEVPGIADC